MTVLDDGEESKVDVKMTRTAKDEDGEGQGERTDETDAERDDETDAEMDHEMGNEEDEEKGVRTMT